MTSTNGDIEIPQPKKLGVGQTPDGLIEIEIQLRKYHLWVSEADVFTRFRLSFLITELMKEIGEATEYPDQIRRNMLTEVWAPLVVCSRGDVPTKEQFQGLPPADMALWIDTAKKLGHTFEWLDGLNKTYSSAMEQAQAEKEDVKKKNRKRADHRRAHEVVAG